MVLIRLKSDNFENTLLTVDAYETVVMEMSTGDHATHTTELYVCPIDHAPTYHYIEGDELVEIVSDNQEWNPSIMAG